MHVPGEHDQVDPAELQPVGHLAVTCRPIRIALHFEDTRGQACRLRAGERPGIGAIRCDGRERQPGLDHRLQIRPLARYEHANHASSPITSVSGGGSGTTAHIPIPTLKTLRSSSSSTPCSDSQENTRVRPAGRGKGCR